jgi:sugar-specific transcriptional regulator TrmB
MKIVEVLKSLGLSEYESKALIALLSKGALTAKEVAEVSNIPRTSVYDVMNSLLSKGFIQASGKPLRFKALNSEEIISILSKKYSESIEYLKKELPKFESVNQEIDEIVAYRGDAVLNKLRELVMNSRKEIIAVLSYMTDELKEILKKAKCKVVVMASNASEFDGRNAVKYEFKRKEEVKESFKNLCHGMIIFDGEVIMIIFLGNIKIGIMSESRALLEFSSMLITPLLNLFKASHDAGER